MTDERTKRPSLPLSTLLAILQVQLFHYSANCVVFDVVG